MFPRPSSVRENCWLSLFEIEYRGRERDFSGHALPSVTHAAGPFMATISGGAENQQGSSVNIGECQRPLQNRPLVATSK